MGDTPNWDELSAAPAPEQSAPKPSPEHPPDWGSLSKSPPKGEEHTPEWDSLTPKEEKYGTTGQQLLAGAEGAAQGFAGPLATAAELGLSKLGVPGLSAEDQTARKKENPYAHGIGEAAGLGTGLLTGTGEIGLIGKAAAGASEALNLGKLGAAAIKGAISGGLFQTGEEGTKWMLGQEDPEQPVASSLAHIGFGTLLGSGAEAGLNIMSRPVSAGLKKIADSKITSKAAKFVEDFGARMKDISEGTSLSKETVEKLGALRSSAGVSTPSVSSPGAKLADKLTDFLSSKTKSAISAGTIGATEGYREGGFQGAIKGGISGAAAGFAMGKLTNYFKPVIGKTVQDWMVPNILRVLQSGHPEAMVDAMTHAENVYKGEKAIQYGVNALFSDKSLSGMFESKDKDKDKIKKFVESGGTTRQMQNELEKEMQPSAAPSAQAFAEGGEVKPQEPKDSLINNEPDHFANVFPSQNVMMVAAKGRVYNYLNSLRPQPNQTKLPFDDETPETEAHRKYDKAVNIAASPLSIIHSVKNGSLTPEELGHFKTMWPEIHSQLSQGMTKKIVEAQQKKEKPSYKVRQAMSLFLGTPLDSTMTPQMMQAAQSVYAKKQPPQQPPGKTKKGTSKLNEVSKQYQTGNQAASARSKGG